MPDPTLIGGPDTPTRLDGIRMTPTSCPLARRTGGIKCSANDE
jgi:hypothetical protein